MNCFSYRDPPHRRRGGFGDDRDGELSLEFGLQVRCRRLADPTEIGEGRRRRDRRAKPPFKSSSIPIGAVSNRVLGRADDFIGNGIVEKAAAEPRVVPVDLAPDASVTWMFEIATAANPLDLRLAKDAAPASSLGVASKNALSEKKEKQLAGASKSPERLLEAEPRLAGGGAWASKAAAFVPNDALFNVSLSYKVPGDDRPRGRPFRVTIAA